MRGLGLGESGIGFFFHRVNQVGKSDGVLNKEDRNVITHQIPITFFSVKLDGKSPNITGQIKGPLASRNSRKSYKGRRFSSGMLEQISPGILGKLLIVFKIAVGTVASRMYYPFWNSFVVKVKDFLPEMEIFHSGWTASSDFERIMIIHYRSALGGGQDSETIFSRLM